MTEQTIDEDEIDLLDLIAVMWRRRILIAVFTAVAAVAAVGVSLLLKNYYAAKATVLPVSSDSSSMLSQYAGLASMAGISLPGGKEGSPTQKIAAILNSRMLAERIIADKNLIPVLVEKPDKVKPPLTPAGVALEAFQKEVFSVANDEKSGLISISVELKDPVLAADTANYAVSLLERILNEKALTVSKKNRRMMESQITEQELKVKELQNKLTSFQQSSGILIPQGQIEQSMTLYSTLVGQKISLEIELSRMESALSADNPKISALKTQLAAVEDQLTKIETRSAAGGAPSLRDTPEALVKYQNIMTDLEIATKIYGSLLATLENQKLQENEDQLFVEVIDSAIPPEIKSKPRRSIICVVATMAGFFLGVLAAFVLEAWKNVAPQLKAKLAGQ